MKGRIDTLYAVSKDYHYKHRALFITKPSWNMTGDYTCHVQTFQSNDKKTGHLQLIGKIYRFVLNFYIVFC